MQKNTWKETNMASLNRYIEYKFREKYSIPKTIFSSGDLIANHAGKIAFLVIVKYISEHGVNDYITAIYDEPFEYWDYGVAIPSALEFERRGYSLYKLRQPIIKTYNESKKLFSELEEIIEYFVANRTDKREIIKEILLLPKGMEYLALQRKRKTPYYSLKDLVEIATSISKKERKL